MFLALSLALVPPAHAQRYLTEFVGTAQITSSAGSVAIDTSLSFDDQLNRSLGGDFSFRETDAFGVTEVELFSVEATLASSGQCPARLSGDATSGHLQLDEYTFDAGAFALYGSLDVDRDLGDVRLTTSRVRGPTAFLNAPADFLRLPSDRGLLTLSGGAGDQELELQLGGVEDNGASRGTAWTLRGEAPYSVVVSANARWFYLLAVGDQSLVVGRGAVSLDRDSLPAYAEGTWEELTEAGKTLDAGRFTIDLR